MFIETTIGQAEVGLGRAADSSRAWRESIRPGRALAKLVLTGVLLMYLAGWVRDFQRVRGLEAEPTPRYKIITKYEAWERIYPRPNRENITGSTSRPLPVHARPSGPASPSR